MSTKLTANRHSTSSSFGSVCPAGRMLRLMLAVMLVGCTSPPVASVNPGLRTTGLPPGEALLAVHAAAVDRLLALGRFMVPASLVSVGSGSLVSVGSGTLVSVGSGSVTTSTAGGHDQTRAYRLQETPPSHAPDVPGADAPITLAWPAGESTNVAPSRSDADGGYRLHGDATAGVYRIEARVDRHVFLTLIALRSDAPSEAAIDAATTLVATRLLAAQPHGRLEVLPTDAFDHSVAAVREVLRVEGLPAGWTPDDAGATMDDLERRHTVIALAMSELKSSQDRLEQRVSGFQFQLKGMADELGLAPELVRAELRAALSEAPSASDDQVAARVRSRVGTQQPVSMTSGTGGSGASPPNTNQPVTPPPVATPPSPTPVSRPGSGGSGGASGSSALSSPPSPAPGSMPQSSATPLAGTASPLPSPSGTPAPPNNAPTPVPTTDSHGQKTGQDASGGQPSPASTTPTAAQTTSPLAGQVVGPFGPPSPASTPQSPSTKPSPTPAPSSKPSPSSSPADANNGNHYGEKDLFDQRSEWLGRSTLDDLIRARAPK